jgi:SNF2 family DNA or RNA helicase
VIVHRIICAGTLDERVLSVLTRKDATQRSLLTALKEYVEELR